MLSKILKLPFVFILSCSENLPDYSESSSESGESGENFPHKYIDLSCDKCFENEICFEGQCQYYGSLIYDVTVLSFQDPRICDNSKYKAFLDSKLVYESSISASKNCLFGWQNESFQMVGDQILYFEFWNLIDFKSWHTKLCYQKGSKYYKTELDYDDKNCTQFPYQMVNTTMKLTYIRQNIFLMFSVIPVASLDVDLY